jgi:putative N6-adenine-specific DNA methylase
MSLFNTIAPITITCHKRVAPYLTKEVESLGYTNLTTFITGVTFEGTLIDCIRLNLNLRCASQILYTLLEFKASHPDELYEELSECPWEDIIPEDAHLSITSNVMNEHINNSMFANLRVKDAITDRLRKIRGNRPNTGSELKGLVIHLFWKNDEATVFIDTSGPSLGRHGYRKIPGRAPMLESLAAATILASNWNKKSVFVNPMCGSGTLAIEAALIATNRPPSLFRGNYSFMHISGFQKRWYFDAMNEVKSNIINSKLDFKIIASDYDSQAIINATENAKAAGVNHLIDFQLCDFAETKFEPQEGGVMFMNPEYGERLGEASELELTYGRIGTFLKQKCSGMNGYVFTGNFDLAKKIGLKPKRKIEFYNSKIDCRLFEYEMYSGSKR